MIKRLLSRLWGCHAAGSDAGGKLRGRDFEDEDDDDEHEDDAKRRTEGLKRWYPADM